MVVFSAAKAAKVEAVAVMMPVASESEIETAVALGMLFCATSAAPSICEAAAPVAWKSPHPPTHTASTATISTVRILNPP